MQIFRDLPHTAFCRLWKNAVDWRNFRVVVRPARLFKAILRIAHGLANDGLCSKKGIPRSIWHLALLFEMGETYTPKLPHKLQTGLFRVLVNIARWFGKHKELEKYYKAPDQSFSL